MATKSKEQNLSQLFSQLQECGLEGDYDQCLTLSQQILSIAPDDCDALRFRVTCLIHLSNFSDALTLIDRVKDCDFERAYCVYRLDRLSESEGLLSQLPPTLLPVRELKAQLRYKQGAHRDAALLYNQLCTEVQDDFSGERESNRLAALATGGAVNDVNPGTMEQYFNYACCLLSGGCYGEALEALHSCEQVCRSSLLDEGYSEDEMAEELGVVRVQQAYALQMLARYKDALELYSSVLKTRPADISQTVVASNNIIALRRDKDVFDSKKKMKVLVAQGSSKRFTQTQKLSILYNRALFALGTNQLDTNRNLIAQLKSLAPDSSLTAMATAALCVRERRPHDGIQVLRDYLLKSCDVKVSLTLAQLYLTHGQPLQALETLSAIPQLCRHVGLVSAVVALATSLGRIDTADGLLDQALSVWRDVGGPTLYQVMLEAARFKLSHFLPSEAAKVLEELHSLQPQDIKVTALLISAYSRYSPKLAEELSASLGHAASATAVDVDSLEHMPSFRHSRRPLVKEPSKDKAPLAKTPRKKKRKPRLPKSCDPTSPIDKERWLPLRERSYFRRGKKKGFIGSGRGSQGVTTASASLMAALDANKPKPTTDTGAELASPKAKPTAQPQKKKSKKKKSKW